MSKKSKIKAILIDDNKIHLSSLMILLQRHCPEIEICDTCRSAAEGLESITMHQPNLIFLDIQMEHEIAGFELLEKTPERTFDVIFTTQHDIHALRAFEVYPIDFLVKPIDPNRLKRAVNIVKERNIPILSEGLLDGIKDVYTNTEQIHPVIPIPTMQGSEFIKVADIIRCEVATHKGNRTLFYLKSQKKPILCSKTLKYVESDLLQGHAFCRIHQSHLVNRVHLKSYIKDAGQQPQQVNTKPAAGGWLTMVDNAILPVSKAGKKRLLG